MSRLAKFPQSIHYHVVDVFSDEGRPIGWNAQLSLEKAVETFFTLRQGDSKDILRVYSCTHKVDWHIYCHLTLCEPEELVFEVSPRLKK